MNLLYVLLANLDSDLRPKLSSISPRGTVGLVWQLINEQAASGSFDKKAILDKTGISSSHLDKITSELLGKCYSALFGEDILTRLDALSSTVALLKLFYNELAKQCKDLSGIGDKDQQAAFIKKCFVMMGTNMPIAYRDSDASARLARLYISLFKGEQKKEAVFYMGYKLVFEKMEMLFAATEFKEKSSLIAKELHAIGRPLPSFSEETLSDYYWTWIYYHHALEGFAAALATAEEALITLQRFDSETNKVNMLRIELKVNEMLYYLSRFDESYERYGLLVHSGRLATIPERQYHLTKYIQLTMITGHLDEAGRILKEKLDEMGDKVEQQIIVRDIVTYVKYCLFRKEYDTAFRFLQLGFEKNPKGKYFQYEIELRNLQTAYFYLSGQEDVALDMCRKHIKFLRNHGYTGSSSDYPHFYILVKAIFDSRAKGGLSPRNQKMMNHYQQGSYAIYGRLLQLMLSR